MLVRVAYRCLCTRLKFVDSTYKPNADTYNIARVKPDVLLVAAIVVIAAILVVLAAVAVLSRG